MSAELFFQLFHRYGLILVCAVIFCEYMNLPGFPAGVIMPSIGVLIAQSELSLWLTIALSVVFGVLGSLVIYGACYWGGEPIMEKLFGKSEKVPPRLCVAAMSISTRSTVAGWRCAALSRCCARSCPSRRD